MDLTWFRHFRSNAIGCGLLAKPAKFSNVHAYTVGLAWPFWQHKVDEWVADATALILPDAVPKKRGPKTDVLDALLKRVDGLEAKLKEKSSDQISPTTPTVESHPLAVEASSSDVTEPSAKRLAMEAKTSPQGAETSAVSSTTSGTKFVTPSKAHILMILTCTKRPDSAPCLA
jgi:hypothetical protein